MLIFNKISCCNNSLKGRVYYIDDKRYLIFADSCPNCNRAIAEIRHKNKKGELCINVRRSGESALRLFEKYYSKRVFEWKIPFGTKRGEYTFINKFGVVFNENGVRIAPQDEFLSMTREEVNEMLNRKRLVLN